jgi:uncharacterized protein
MVEYFLTNKTNNMKKYLFCAILLMLLGYASQAQGTQVNQPLTADEAYNKGLLFGFSGLVIKDIEKAKNFFLQAVTLGHTKANFELGKIYAAEDNSASKIKAVSYFEKAAQLGITDAWTQLGYLFYQTKIENQDFEKAFAYFKKGAEANNNDCLAVVGYFYFKGLNKEQDYTKAFEYFTKAAEKDNPMAIYFIGLQYRNGYGVERNKDLARSLLVKSSRYNHFQAIKELEIKEPENPIQPIETPKIIQLDQVNGYKRIKHNMNEASIAGAYKGYAIRYDFSGKNILSVFPLEVNFKIDGNNVTGTWKEEDKTTNVTAIYSERGLSFLNTEYNKIDHYSEFKGGEVWQFNNAKFNLLQQSNSTYITGNIQLYSNLRKEPGLPLYIHLSRTTSSEEAKELNKNTISLTSNNPFTDNIQATFKIVEASPVILKLYNAEGTLLFTENAGVLPEGTYTRSFNIAGKLAGGSYVLKLETKTDNTSIIIIKQ